jgi:hypothetical protein
MAVSAPTPRPTPRRPSLGPPPPPPAQTAATHMKLFCTARKKMLVFTKMPLGLIFFIFRSDFFKTVGETHLW